MKTFWHKKYFEKTLEKTIERILETTFFKKVQQQT
jgi:hypothetical protein